MRAVKDSPGFRQIDFFHSGSRHCPAGFGWSGLDIRGEQQCPHTRILLKPRDKRVPGPRGSRDACLQRLTDTFIVLVWRMCRIGLQGSQGRRGAAVINVCFVCGQRPRNPTGLRIKIKKKSLSARCGFGLLAWSYLHLIEGGLCIGAQSSPSHFESPAGARSQLWGCSLLGRQRHWGVVQPEKSVVVVVLLLTIAVLDLRHIRLSRCVVRQLCKVEPVVGALALWRWCAQTKGLGHGW